LIALGTALAQAEHGQEAERCWQEAERIISSISYEGDKAKALRALGTALVQAGCWQEAERVIGSIFYAKDKTQALWKLVIALAQDHKHGQIVSVVQREWLQTVSRANALDLFSLVLSLVPHYSNLAMALYDAFVWVDSFLKG
jgi:tetratricopeptide (TPR) repeat protein